MAQRTVLLAAAAALLLLSGCAAQNNFTRESSGLGSADATAQSQQIIVPGNGGQRLMLAACQARLSLLACISGQLPCSVQPPAGTHADGGHMLRC